VPGPMISIGSVGVDVVPNAQGVYARLAAQLLPDVNRLGEQAGRQLGQRMQSGMARDGAQAGGSFGRAMRTRLEAALRALPNIRIGANTSEADADIQALRVRLETLTNRRIGIDIDAAAARAEAADIEEQLRRLGAAHPNVQVRVDTAAARAALAEFRSEVDRLSRTSVSPRIEVEGGFAQRLRAAVEAAQAQLPDITVDANTGTAAAQLQVLRGQLDALRNVRVGIDIDAATALARIADVQRRLDQVAAGDATADVRVDAAAASATLAAVQAQVDALDGDTARIDIDVSSAAAGLVRLTTLAAGIGPAIAPAAAGAAFGLGAFVSVLSAATIGVGAFAAAATPGLIGVGKAVQATTAANDALAAAQDKTARSSAAQAVAAQQQALAMAGAQASLAQAQRTAVQQVADAREQAARRMDQALDRINDADRQRTDALRDQERAEKALLDARRAAAEQLEDLRARQAGGALSERAAVIAVEKAQADLDAVKKSGAAADSLAAREAQLAYDEAAQRLQDQRRENKRLAEEAKSGSKGVAQAEQALAQAKERTAAASKAVRDAEVEARRTQAEGAKAVARAQQQGADAVAAAQRGVASAQLAAAAAAASSTEAMSAANTAVDKQARLLADLTPAQRSVYDAVLRLKDAFRQWGESLAPATMPLVVRAIDGLTRTLPGLTPLVLAAADGLDRLGDRAGAAFDNPFWDRFRDNLVANLPRAIESMGVTFGNVFAGMAGVINAFLPQTDAIGDSMEDATASFREWGQGLETSAGFKSFREFLAEDWPGVREAFADVGSALWQITRALAEVSPSAVLILQGVATAIENTPVWLIQALVDAFFAYRVALFAMAAAKVVYVGAMAIYTAGTVAATGATWALGTAIRAIPLVGLIAVILTLIGTFVLLMIQSESFRAKVVSVFREIGSWAMWLWDKAIGPAFRAIGAAAMWLWDNAIRPAFDGIMLGAKILAAVVAVVLFAPFLIAFQLLSAAAMFLWEQAIRPAFDGIAAGAVWLWDNALGPVARHIGESFQVLGGAAMWLWQEAIKPAFDGIGAGIKFVYDWFIKPPIDLAMAAFRKLGEWAKTLHDEWIKPWFDKVGAVVSTVTGGFEEAFRVAKDGIGRVWDEIKAKVAQPIDWVIDLVYNNGIVAVWNAVAKRVGLTELDEAPKIAGNYATGGIFPGYTPGRDVGFIGVSGGEAIIRPEGTRALGASWVHGLNAASRAGGVAGAQAFLSGGQDRYLGGFAFGGIVGDFLGDVKEKAKDIVRGLAADGVELMLKPVRALVNTLLPDSPDWMRMAKGVPMSLMDGFVDKVRGDDRAYLQASGSLSAMAALGWARSQAGKPYQWGGSGNPSWDCSGFMAAIAEVISGRSPRRLWTTFDFVGASAPNGWRQNADAPFRVGVSNLGVGHMAGTILGTNVESRGGDGVVVGPAARGADHPMFADRYGYLPSLGAAAGPAATGALGTWIAMALAATGTPPPGSLDAWTRGMATLVGRESGGNLLAVNTTDSNAARGTPSSGLAQVIGPTFAAYREPGLSNNIFDPVANLAASINYIKARYGDISKVQQADPNRPPKGYALGGIIPMRAYDSGGPLPPGLTLAYNGTGRTERVYTAPQNARLLSLAGRGEAAGGGSGPALHVEHFHAAANHDPRRIAEEVRGLARARGGRRG
jgi:hypothetical protein